MSTNWSAYVRRCLTREVADSPVRHTALVIEVDLPGENTRVALTGDICDDMDRVDAEIAHINRLYRDPSRPPALTTRSTIELAASLAVGQWRTLLREEGHGTDPQDEHEAHDLHPEHRAELVAWVGVTACSGRGVGYWSSVGDSPYDRVAKAAEIAGEYVTERDLRRYECQDRLEHRTLCGQRRQAKATAHRALPLPRSTVWDADTKAVVVARLLAGRVESRWCSPSKCRICGALVGSCCLTDGVWTWPEGLAHYVEEHDVAPLTEEFIRHLLTPAHGEL